MASHHVHFACLVALAVLVSSKVQVKYDVKTFSVPLDHFTFTTNQTFNVRYFINDDWWDPNVEHSAIFFYTGNEGNIRMFAENSGLLWELAPVFNAIVVFAEHRYYGESVPFGNLSYADPKYSGYLSTSQALADYVDLIEHLKVSYPKEGGAPTPVIAFGGSYGGMLAAWLRIKYPAVVDGSLASSAPIWFFSNIAKCDDFYKATTTAYRESGSQKCVNVIKQSWDAINNFAKSEDGMQFLNQIFKPCVPMMNQKDVFAFKYWLTNMYFNLAMINYPYDWNFLAPLPGHPVKVVCGLIEDTDLKDRPLVEAVFKFATFYFNSTGTLKCMDFKLQGTPDLDIYRRDYQGCTELVMPFCDNDGSTLFENAPWDIEQFSDFCYETYKVRPLPDYAYKMYGGKKLSASSNIIFSNGLLDPWTSVGVTYNVSATSIAVMLPGCAHHVDLHFSNPLDPPSVRAARKMYRSIFMKWIKDSSVQANKRN